MRWKYERTVWNFSVSYSGNYRNGIDLFDKSICFTRNFFTKSGIKFDSFSGEWNIGRSRCGVTLWDFTFPNFVSISQKDKKLENTLDKHRTYVYNTTHTADIIFAVSP